MNDPFNLQRFVVAQDKEGFDGIIAELRRGKKVRHWMWFVFPQIRGLGTSSTTELFSISSLKEAKAYAKHQVLGHRLIECTRLVNAHEAVPIDSIFRYPDNLKFHSCMTLFARASPEDGVFTTALEKHFASRLDALTMSKL